MVILFIGVGLRTGMCGAKGYIPVTPFEPLLKGWWSAVDSDSGVWKVAEPNYPCVVGSVPCIDVQKATREDDVGNFTRAAQK